MKKLLVLFFAIAMVAAFTAPALAADAPMWNFYGSARMATWYSNTSSSDDDIIPRGSVTGGFAGDDQALIWDLQGNSRIGARVNGETISGRFEYGSGPNLRILYGTYTTGDHEFLVGQSYTPLAYRFYSNQAFNTDDGLLSAGNFYTGRDPMLQWKMGGLRIALVKPGTSIADLGDDVDTDTTLPQLEARYVYKTDAWALDVFGGASTFKLDGEGEQPDDDVTAYMLGLGGEFNFGAGFFKAQAWLARNEAQLGGASIGRNTAVVVGSDVIDNDGVGIMGVLGFKATDTMTFEVGAGYTEHELDVSEADKDNTAVYYINAIIDIAPGFFIVPEIGYYDFLNDTSGLDEGAETYFGLKWQINF